MKPSPVNYCERCSQLLQGEIVWLELSITDGRYYRTLPAGHKSQGLFAFGADCAEQVLKHGALNKRRLKTLTKVKQEIRSYGRSGQPNKWREITEASTNEIWDFFARHPEYDFLTGPGVWWILASIKWSGKIGVKVCRWKDGTIGFVGTAITNPDSPIAGQFPVSKEIGWDNIFKAELDGIIEVLTEESEAKSKNNFY